MSNPVASSGRWILIMVITSVVALALLLLYFLNVNDDGLDGAAVKMNASRTGALTTGIDATDAYVEQLEEYSLERAQQAEKNGTSYVTPVIRGSELTSWDEMRLNDAINGGANKIEQPEPSYQPSAPPPEPPVDHSEQFLALAKLWSVGAHSDHVHAVPDLSSPVSDAAIQPAVFTPNPLLGLVDVGDVLYASIDLNIDTDYERSGFVKSTVLAGSLRGAQLFGRFAHRRTSDWGESVTIEFDQIILPSGESADIDGLAIDPKYSRTSIAHEVDYHYFYRWGSLFTASLLKGWEGFARATAQSGTQSALGLGLGAGTLLRTTPKYSIKDRAMIGSGEIARELSSALKENFRRPNTVRIFASHMGGRPIGIVIRSFKQGQAIQTAAMNTVAQQRSQQQGAVNNPRLRTENDPIPLNPSVDANYPVPDLDATRSDL